MKLIKLGKVSKGVEYFELYDREAEAKGFTIKCTGVTMILTFNNVRKLFWSNSGKTVLLESKHHLYDSKPFDLSMWQTVEITRADKVRDRLLDIARV